MYFYNGGNMSLNGVSAEYTVKKLYEVSTGSSEDSKTFESMWGYSLSYLGKVETGRVRIRITKMSASDFLAAFGKNPDADEYASSDLSGYSISGYLVKWQKDRGWVMCLDWLGEPEASNLTIEQELLDMFKAFVTGMPSKILMSDPDDSPGFSKPRYKSTIDFSKYIKSNEYDKDEFPEDDAPKAAAKKPKPKPKNDSDDDDIDWI